jgi:hypothetical protein
MFLNRWVTAQYRALASIILGRHFTEKSMYKAVVWQRLRTTALEGVAIGLVNGLDL